MNAVRAATGAHTRRAPAGSLVQQRRHVASERGELVDQLPEILADRIQAPGLGRLPQTMAPGRVEGRLVARLDAILPEHGLADLDDCDQADLTRIQEDLAALEHELSDLRRGLFDRIDALQPELTRRYRDGEARVDELLQDQPPA